MALQWFVDVDWDGDSVYEADESDHLIGLSLSRGRNAYVKADGKGFEPMQAGSCVIQLTNYDGRYNPFNASSAIYPNVVPGRSIKIRVNNGATTYTLINGLINDIVPLSQSGAAPVRIEIVDGTQWLKDKVTRKAVQTSITTDTAIGYILTDASYPAAWGDSLDTGSDTLSYWWAYNEKALDAIHHLVESELGIFYIAGDGKATFISRTNTYSTTAAFTLDESQCHKTLLLAQPWTNLRNVVRVLSHPLVAVAGQTLWTLQQKPPFAPGRVRTFLAQFSYNNKQVPASTVTSPVATTDYTANTLANGTGTNLTANFTVTMTAYGKTAQLVVTNTGAQAGYLTLLKLRGTALDAPDTTIEETDNSSGSLYGTRTLQLDLPWQQDVNVAADLSQFLATYLGSPLRIVTVTLEDRDTVQFNDLGTVITFTSATLGIDALYRIMSIKHEWVSSTGQGVRTTWRLEPVNPTHYWLLGVTGYSELGETTRLAY